MMMMIVLHKVQLKGPADDSAMHYAAIESNRELNKSLKVIALLLLIFGPNMIILFLTCVKP